MVMAVAAFTFMLYLTQDSQRIDEQTETDAKSITIAVLPLKNLSSDKDQEYLSDGLTEELLNVMTRETELKVIGRTSSFQLKNSDASSEKLAQQLGADYLLEGSVRKSGRQIRVTINLLEAESGRQIWSDNYERELNDIFALQDSVAAAVVMSLEIEFLGLTQRKERDKVNSKAYDYYLQALRITRHPDSESLLQQEQYLQQALAIAPEFTEARLKLAINYYQQMNTYLLSVGEGLPKTEQSLAQVLQENSKLAGAHTLMGNIQSTYYLDWVQAESHYQKALDLNPNDPLTLSAMGFLVGAFGDIQRGLILTRQSRKLDPLNFSHIHNEAFLNYLDGNYKEAEKFLLEAIQFAGKPYPSAYLLLGLIAISDGRAEKALEYIQQEQGEKQRMSGLMLAYLHLGEKERAEQMFSNFRENYGQEMPVPVAGNYVQNGDFDAALEWFERAYEKGDPNLMTTMVHPINEPIKDDPRFQQFLKKLKLLE
jgi:TolB-like protein/Tfp pilus assembly protein PilF